MNLLALWIALGVFLCSVAGAFMVSRRKKVWYRVYLANNDVRLMYRSWRERWQSSDKYARFRDDKGYEVTFPAEAHWVLMFERIPNGEVDAVRAELVAGKHSLERKEA